MIKKHKGKKPTYWMSLLCGILLISICFILSSGSKGETSVGNSSNPVINLQTDNETYVKGQSLRIFGTITNISYNTAVASSLYLMIQQGDWMRSTTISLTGFSFDYSYGSSFGDPEGVWNITVEVQMENQTIRSSKNITVLLPSDIVRYNVIWFSPSNDSIYYRGSKMHLSVFVTQNNIGVSNASTFCVFPSLEKVQLTEIKQGYYESEYTIPYESREGTWSISVESITRNGSSVYAGGNNIVIHIVPVPLSVDVMGSLSHEYLLGNPIQLSIIIQYVGGQSVNNATVTTQIANETYLLQNQGEGLYQIDVTKIIKTPGSYHMSFIASDPFGNSGTSTYILSLVEPTTSPIPILQIIGALILLLCVFVLVYFINQQHILLRKKDLQNEIEELENLRNETALKYYTKGTITRQTYDLLETEYVKRLAELRNEKPAKKTKGMKFSFKKKNNIDGL
jgi:hypothetical protein